MAIQSLQVQRQIAFRFGYFNLPTLREILQPLNSKCIQGMPLVSVGQERLGKFNQELLDNFLLLHQTSLFFTIFAT